MKKKKSNITKEIYVLLILIILILLVMAVALYDFVPANINLPESITYTADRATTSVKQEIAYTNGGDISADENNADEEELIIALKSYSVQASDLTVYGEKNLYNSGNSNPFDYAEEQTVTQTPATTTNPTTAEGTTSSNNSGTATNNNSQPASQLVPTDSSAGQAATPNATGGSTTGTFFESPTSK